MNTDVLDRLTALHGEARRESGRSSVTSIGPALLSEVLYDAASEIERLGKDRDYWKVEAEGERAKVAWRDKKAQKLRKAFDDMIMMVDFEKCKITIAFETAEETEAAQKALSEAIGWENIGETA